MRIYNENILNLKLLLYQPISQLNAENYEIAKKAIL